VQFEDEVTLGVDFEEAAFPELVAIRVSMVC
jgi:hypothetical protein